MVWKSLRKLSRDDCSDEFDPWISGKSITLARNPKGGDYAGHFQKGSVLLLEQWRTLLTLGVSLVGTALENIAIKADFTCTKHHLCT